MINHVTICVIDDDGAFRDSLRFLLESAGYTVAAYESGNSFLTSQDMEHIGCILLDVRMTGMSGLELQNELKQRAIPAPIIFLTGHGDVPMAVEAIKRGAFEFIEKPVNDAILLGMIERALQHDADTRRARARQLSAAARLATLSPREYEVMERVVAGKPNKVIAEDLGISVKTVEAHRARMMMKTGADSIAELVQLALDGLPPQNR